MEVLIKTYKTMKPYARRNQKLRINNRKKFNAGSRRVSWEFKPNNYPRPYVPYHLMLKRLAKVKRQGLTKDELEKYIWAMV